MWTDAEIWNACESVLNTEKKPLEINRVAQASGLSEDHIITALIKETGIRRRVVVFRYPPLPCAALERIE